MSSDNIFLTLFYFIVSVLVFLCSYSISRRLSGEGFKEKWFWLCLAGVLLWGTVQYNVARHGSILFFSSPLEFLVSNYWIRWIAFISAVLQAICIPSKTMHKPNAGGSI